MDETDDPWTKTFDLLFHDNPSFPKPFSCYSSEGFALLNFVQQQFVGFDIWYGRYLNGGFDAAFFDPRCSIAAAYLALPALGWPEFETSLRWAIENTLSVSAAQIATAVDASDVWLAGNRLAETSGWKAGHPSAAQVAAKDEFELWYSTYEQQVELDRRVMGSIWQQRHHLIRAPN